MIKLGNLKPPSRSKLNASLACLIGSEKVMLSRYQQPGEVYPWEIIDSSVFFVQQYFQFLVFNGYQKRRSLHWSSLDLIYCKGSIRPHTDTSGLIALWLLNVNSHRFQDRPIIGCKSKNIELLTGDVVVFNSDAEHYWLSNMSVCMITQSIRKKRCL
jgi:hypothetical protein